MNNKAILPVLTQMFPNHPLLLRAEFQLSAELRSAPSGYVTKPIVGRSGSNVTLFAPGGRGVLESLGGKFSEKDVVYQEAFALPRVDDTSMLVCLWVVQGRCAGFVVRVLSRPSLASAASHVVCDAPHAALETDSIALERLDSRAF